MLGLEMVQLIIFTVDPKVIYLFPLSGSISPTCVYEAFTREDPKCAKRQSNHHCLFALLGSPRGKAAHKTLVKLTLGFDEWPFHYHE